MAQLQLFPPPPVRGPTTPEQVCDPAARRTHPYRVPIYRVTLVRETSITAPRPRLRSAQDAAELLRQYLGEVDREHLCAA